MEHTFEVSGVGFQEKVTVEYHFRDTKDVRPSRKGLKIIHHLFLMGLKRHIMPLNFGNFKITANYGPMPSSFLFLLLTPDTWHLKTHFQYP